MLGQQSKNLFIPNPKNSTTQLSTDIFYTNMNKQNTYWAFLFLFHYIVTEIDESGDGNGNAYQWDPNLGGFQLVWFDYNGA